MIELDPRLHFVVTTAIIEIEFRKDLTDYAWITVEEGKNYDLID